MSNVVGEGRSTSAGARHAELKLRVLSGCALVLLALAATWAGGWAFAILWGVAGVAISAEWVGVTGAEPRILLVAIAATGLVALTLTLAWATVPGIVVGLVIATLALLALTARTGSARIWACSGFCYAAVAVAAPILLRGDERWGVAIVLWVFAVVWTTDIAAFFVGRALGGPKLSPSVSPNKTWSGFVGGLLAATLAGTALAAFAGGLRPGHLILVAGASATASAVCQGGDLGESWLKRHFGVKDAGNLIPGHGGVMDRLDGFVPVAFFAGILLAGLAVLER